MWGNLDDFIQHNTTMHRYVLVKYAAAVVAVTELLFAILVISYYADATAGSHYTCDGVSLYNARISERTSGMGIFSGIIATFLAGAAICVFLFLGHSKYCTVSHLSVAGATVIVWIFVLITWALMIKDLSGFHDNMSLKRPYCNEPSSWVYALAFAVLLWLTSVVLFVASIVCWRLARESAATGVQ